MNFLYSINHSPQEKDLAHLEMRTFFPKTWKENIENKLVFSSMKIDPSDSPFIKARLEVIFKNSDFSKILEFLEREKIQEDGFKVEYFKLEHDNITYPERIEKCRKIGMGIIGTPKMTDYKKLFGITLYKNMWILGVYEKNSFSWYQRVDKPHSYSNSLDTKLAKTLVNLAIDGDKKHSIIDVCSGVGTIVIEGLSMGANILGCEINGVIAENANNNLIHYGFSPCVANLDMHEIKGLFHSSILDIPYGIFSHITPTEQQGLIDSCKKISKRLILISFENLEHMIIHSGFKILDWAILRKGKFQRYIWVCQ